MLGSQPTGQGTGRSDGRGEDLIAVPAGLWGSIIAGLGGAAGHIIGGKTGQTISSISQGIGAVSPFSTIPSGAGPQGQPGGEDLIAVPAGLWGSIIAGLGGAAGHIIGGNTGQTISSISQTVGAVSPFSIIPSGA
jgi:hypothetical protein